MKGWRFEIVLLLLLLSGGVLWQLHLRPVEKPWPEAEEGGREPVGLEGAPALLVIAADQVAASKRRALPDRDWSYAWINWLEQEVGPYRVTSPSELPSKLDAKVLLVVVSRSAWPRLDEAGKEALRAHSARGGVVVAETPPGDEAIPGQRSVVLDDPFSTALVKIQQGWVDPRGAPPEARPRVPLGRIQADQQAGQRKGEVLLPMADRLERDLMTQVHKLLPMPRWWPFPEAAAGAVMATYEEGGFGDEAGWMARYDAERKVPGALFAVPLNFSERGAGSLRRSGTELALGWNRGYYDILVTKRWGMGPLECFWREASLTEQRELLMSRTGEEEAPIATRSNGLVWDPEFSRTFRIIEAAGFRADASYGPASPDQAGYLFGTGLPFHPLDDEGLPFSLYELPFVLRNDYRYDRKLQARLIEGSALRDHQLIQVLFHSDVMVRRPSQERMEAWLGLAKLATRHDHRFVGMREYLDFWDARLKSPLSCTWKDEVLDCEVEVRREGLTLAVPVSFRGNQPRGARLDDEPLNDDLWVVRGSHRLLVMSAGRHRLRLPFRRLQAAEDAP